MLRILRQNLVLKIVSVATAVMIWAYVGAERTAVKQVIAEVQKVGTPPPSLIVQVAMDPIPIEVAGPKDEVQSLAANGVKALVDLATARASSRRLMVVRYALPPSAPHVTVPGLPKFVPVDVTTKVRKPMKIGVSFTNKAPFGREFSAARIVPTTAEVMGSEAAVHEVAELVAYVNTEGGGSVRADVPIRALSSEGVVLDGVEVEPSTAHVEVDLVEASATRVLVVSVPLRGQPPPGFAVSDVLVIPAQITVSGPSAELLSLTHVSTAEVSLEGVRSEVVRHMPLQLPRDVMVPGGRTMATVTIRVRDTSRTVP
jgi:YbbR domain-containing protein